MGDRCLCLTLDNRELTVISGEEFACQARDSGSSPDPLLRMKWQPTPVFLPGESHGQKSLVDYSPWGRKESDTAEVTWHACMLSDRICASTLLADGETKAWRWKGLAQSHVGQ